MRFSGGPNPFRIIPVSLALSTPAWIIVKSNRVVDENVILPAEPFRQGPARHGHRAMIVRPQNALTIFLVGRT
jgi:hypothetical protein